MRLIPLTAARGLGITRHEMSRNSVSPTTTLPHPAARCYASAMIAVLAEAPKTIREATPQALVLLQAAVRDDEIVSALKNPRLSRGQALKLAGILAKSVHAPLPLANLLGVVARAGRLSILPDILDASVAQLDALAGVVPVQVISAAPLSDMQKVQLKVMIKAHQKSKDVHLHERVDASLIAGFRAFFGGLVWDTSVSGQLARLKAQLSARVNS